MHYDEQQTHRREEEDHAGEREAAGITKISCREQEDEPQTPQKHKQALCYCAHCCRLTFIWLL